MHGGQTFLALDETGCDGLCERACSARTSLYEGGCSPVKSSYVVYVGAVARGMNSGSFS